MDRQCSAVIYTRVSVAKSHDESVSVANQRELLLAHASGMGWRVDRVFTDDGWSGSDFQRPAFIEMMDYVQRERPDFILVKDLSRFGREFIGVGRYTDYILPELGCKLIALHDSGGAADDDVMLALKSIFNDFYLMDLSRKIKTSHRTMALEGKRVAGLPPYGYKLDPTDRHRFIIDEYAAGIVKRIFGMRAQNYGYTKIAGILNSEGILSPREYGYHVRGKAYPYKIRSVWLTKAVKDIMKNEAYLGHRVQLRQGVMSYKIHKTVHKPEEEWIRVENVHEPIIDRAAWNAARKINERAKAGYMGENPTPALFRGMLRCADCGGLFSIARSNARNSGGVQSASYYKCSRYANSGGSNCSSHTVREDALKQILLADIQRYAAMISTDRNKVIAALREKLRAAPVITGSRMEPERLNKRLDELDRKVAALYEDKVSGVISEQAFTMTLREYESERGAAMAEQSRLTDEHIQTGNIMDWMELVTKHSGVQDIERDLLTELVDRIEIGETEKANGAVRRDIRIFYKLIGAAC
ncbi:resolvase [Clostridia bacterium]|nr:resolvase [Clostridia bacterium]